MVLFLSLQLYPQNGNVTYSNKATLSSYYKTMKENNPSKFKKFEQLAEYEVNIMSQIDYKLIFNRDKSLFKAIIYGNEIGQILKVKQTESVFFKGPAFNYFYVNKRFKDYNVNLAPIKWEITNKSKQILSYVCYKAIGKKVYNDSTALDSKIEAWFTKEINAPHGPKGINNLPGLILEAHHGSYHLYAEEINLDSKEIIYKPSRGEVLDEEEYFKLMRSAVKN